MGVAGAAAAKKWAVAFTWRISDRAEADALAEQETRFIAGNPNERAMPVDSKNQTGVPNLTHPVLDAEVPSPVRPDAEILEKVTLVEPNQICRSPSGRKSCWVL